MTKEDYYNQPGELDFFNPIFYSLPLKVKIKYLIAKEKERQAQIIYETNKDFNETISFENIYDSLDTIRVSIDELSYISDLFFNDDGSLNIEKTNQLLLPCAAKISEILSPTMLILSI